MARLDINLSKMAVMLLPPMLRGGTLQSIVTSAVSVLDYAQSILYTYHMSTPSGTRYRVAHNSQVCKLRAVLNDTYDSDQRRITIGVEQTETHLVTYFEAELAKMEHLQKMHYNDDEDGTSPYTYMDSEVTATDETDFTVCVPSDLSGYDMAIRATIDKYKLVGKTYTILYL